MIVCLEEDEESVVMCLDSGPMIKVLFSTFFNDYMFPLHIGSERSWHYQTSLPSPLILGNFKKGLNMVEMHLLPRLVRWDINALHKKGPKYSV